MINDISYASLTQILQQIFSQHITLFFVYFSILSETISSILMHSDLEKIQEILLFLLI